MVEAADEVLDAISDAIDDYIETAGEISTVSSTPRTRDVSGIKRDLTTIYGSLNKSLGEYEEEIASLLNAVAMAVKHDTGFTEIRREIKDLKAVANQDLEQGAARPEGSVTPVQYRLLLRFYGISDYREKGTASDPEIDENGGLSKWASFGYPTVGMAEAGKKANVQLWTDIWEKIDPKTGDPRCSVSDAYISKQKTEAFGKVKDELRKMGYEVALESSETDIDFQIINELRLIICRQIIEEVLPGGTKLITG